MPVSMWLSLERGVPVPLAAQLAEQLRERVLAGGLEPGDSLPSSRALAIELGVARSVVVRAYEQLNGEGYLESVAGSGTRIAQGIVTAPAAASPIPRAPLPERAERTERTAPSTGAPPAAPSDPDTRAVDLRTGLPFAPPSPPTEWRRALRDAAKLDLSVQAPPPLGDPGLREQIALHARRSRGLHCSPDDVIVTSGTVDALLLIALAIGGGGRWLVEDPGYPEAVDALRLVGAAVALVPVSPEGLRADQLPGDGEPIDAVLVTPSHQFPLGGRMPASERTALVAWAVDRRALIVEDDYDSEFRHVGAALPAIAALDPGGAVAHIGSLNKSFSPGLRCGYVITTAGSPIWRALAEAKTILGSSASLPTQAATALFFESGGFRRYVARTRREYRHRRALLLELLAAEGLRDRLFGHEGGLHAMLRLPEGVDGGRLAEQLRERGVLVESVADFARLPRPDDAIAIGYGAEPVARLERGVAEIARALRASPARAPQSSREERPAGSPARLVA